MRDDEMTDAALDGEIARVLGIEPSTGLAARIRRRVAAEQMSPRWTVSWLFLSATSGAVAAALIAFVIARQNGTTPASVRPLETHAIALRGAAIPDVGPRSVRLENGDSATPASMRLDPSAAAAANTEPEVLIDFREARAILAFIDKASRRRIQTAAPFDPSVEPVVEAEPIRDIYIAPIDMSPLTGDETRGAVPRE